jgi:hypothetical protein
MDDSLDLSRREFTIAGVASLAALSGSATAQEIQTDADGFQSVALLTGPASALPGPDDSFWNNKQYYAYIYRTNDGPQYYRNQDMADWQHLDVVLPQYSETKLPTDLTPGQLVYNDDRGIIALSDGDDWEYPVVGDDILANSVTVENTTARTKIWDAGLSAGSLKPGRVYEINMLGSFSNSSTSDNVTLDVELGGVLVATTQSSAKNSTNAPWRSKTIFTVRDTGTAGEVKPHTIAKWDNVDGDDVHGIETVDTTIAEQIEVYVQWNKAKAGNIFNLGQGYMKEVS